MKRIISTRPDEAYTLNDYITEGNRSEISFGKVTILKRDKVNGTLFPISDILSRYKDILEANTIEVSLNSDEVNKYIYNPNILSYDLYKTTELWFVLMYINNAINFSKFRFVKKLKIYDPNKLDVLNKIVNIEIDKIYKNRTENGI